MQDRFRELQKGGGGAPTGTQDIELGLPISGTQPAGGEEFMNDFFQEVGLIKANFSNIRRNTKAIEEKYVQSLNSISMDQANKGGASELQGLIDETSKIITGTRAQLEALKKNTSAYQNSKGASDTEVRIRNNMHGTLTQKFLELAQEYQEVQTNYKNKYKEKVERQYKIAKPDATTEEIDEAMTSGDSSKIFANQILDTHLHQQATNALAYVQARHQEILRLEASIAELHQLFVDMAVLVDSQGELLNHIESNVSSAKSYTDQGVKEMRSALEYQKKSRKKMYIIICLLIIVVIAILAPTLATQLKPKVKQVVANA